MKLNELTEKLHRVNRDRGPEYVREFEAVLADIAALRDPASIGELVLLFDDNAEFDELMFSLIHTIENFEDALYVEHLLRAAAHLCSQAPRWASIVFMRILNSEATRLELIRQLRNAPDETKAAVRLLMDKINARSAEFLSKTIPVTVAAT